MLERHEHVPSPMVGAGQQCCACFQFTHAVDATGTVLQIRSRIGSLHHH